jgi:zinc/manganese transport system substrate-binding protein
MRMILTRRSGLTSVVATSIGWGLMAGCSGSAVGGDGGEGALIATTTIWADVASNVACDEPVISIIPAGADPHSFEPSLRDRQAIERAAVVVSNGNDLEHSLDDLLDTAIGAGADVVEMAARRPGADPHVWQDPTLVADGLDALAAALVETGRDKATIDACASAYRSELLELDTEIEQILSVVPPERRLLVTSHDSLAYFADRYHFEVVGTVIPASNTLAETSAADLAALAEVIEQRDVPAIFTERLESTADADALAERLGVQVVPLVTDSLVDDPAGDTYVAMMRANATQIAQALAP